SAACAGGSAVAPDVWFMPAGCLVAGSHPAPGRGCGIHHVVRRLRSSAPGPPWVRGAGEGGGRPRGVAPLGPMATLFALLAEHTSLSTDDVEHLQRLVGEWQLLADLSFADLLLWVPTDGGFLCAAQVRPTTTTTAYLADQVGRRATETEAEGLRTALTEQRIFREADPD